MKNLAQIRLALVLLLILQLLVTAIRGQTQARHEAIRLMQEGDYHLRYGGFQQAEFAYTNAIQLDNTFADAYMRRAKLYNFMMLYQESLADHNTAISLNPYSEHLFNQRAKLKMLAMDYKGALDDINAAIAIAPCAGGRTAHPTPRGEADHRHSSAAPPAPSRQNRRT